MALLKIDIKTYSKDNNQNDSRTPCLHNVPERWSLRIFGEWVCNILQCRLMHYVNKLHLHIINDTMILEINVLIVIGDVIILDILDSSLVVTKNDKKLLD